MLSCACGPEEAWAVLDDDNFCANCGRPLRGLAVSQDYVYLDPEAPAPAQVSVEPVGFFPVRVELCWDGSGEPPAWILSRFKLGSRALAVTGGTGVQVAADLKPAMQGQKGSSLGITLALDPSGVERGREYVADMLVSAPAIPGLKRTLRVACHRPPEVEVLPWGTAIGDLRLAEGVRAVAPMELAAGTPATRTWADGPAVRLGARGLLNVYWRNKGGGVLTLKGAKAQGQGLKSTVTWDPAPAVGARPGEVGVASFRFEALRPEEGTVRLQLDFAELARPVTAKLALRVLRPPAPVLHPPAVELALFPYERAAGVTLQLCNGSPTMPPEEAALADDLSTGGEEGRTPAVECTIEARPPVPSGGRGPAEDPIGVLDHDRRHRVVAAGRSKSYTVTFDASWITPEEVGTYRGRLRIRTDAGEVQAPITAEVRPVSPYTDFIGLDFGTSNSCVATLRGQEPQVVTFVGEGRAGASSDEVPSLLYFKGPGRWVIGREARENAVARPDRVVASIKRKIAAGRPIRVRTGDAIEELEPVDLAARAIRSLMGKVSVELARLHSRGPARPGQAPPALPTRAFISVPSAFTGEVRGLIVEACRRAGLEVDAEQGVIEEPAAAALRYIVELKEAQTAFENILVYDWGGGTLDLTVLTYRREKGRRIVSVCASAGRTFGGDDIDRRLMEEVFRRLCALHPLLDGRALAPPEALMAEVADPRLREMHMVNAARIREAAEAAKIALSDSPSASIPVDALEVFEAGRFGLIDLSGEREALTMKREEMEALVGGPVEEASGALLAEVCGQWGRQPGDIDRVLLTGGSSAMPLLRERIVPALLPRARIVTPADFPPKTSVAWGVAYFGLLRTIPRMPFELHGLLEHLSYRIGILLFDEASDAVTFTPILARGPLPVGPLDFPVPITAGRSRLRLYRNATPDDRRGSEPIGWLTIDLARLGVGAAEREAILQAGLLRLTFAFERGRRLSVRLGDRPLVFEPEEGIVL